jgi:hypothetical protein
MLISKENQKFLNFGLTNRKIPLVNGKKEPDIVERIL